MNYNTASESAQEDISGNSENKNAISALEDTTNESIAISTAEKAQDPEWIQEQYNKKANEFPLLMQRVGTGLRSSLRAGNWDGRMATAFAEQDMMLESLESIADKLDKEVPDATDNGSPAHPYLENYPSSVEGWNTVSIAQYRISRDIYRDMDFLKRALSTPGLTHEQQEIIQQLLGTLKQYASYDVGRLAKELITKKQTNGYTSRAMNKMGVITLGLGFGAATLAAGAIGAFHMYSKGKDATGSEMFPAFGLAGLTIFLTNRSLAKSVIGDKYEGALNELSKSVQKPAFKSVAKKYNLHGESGENIAAIMRTKDDTLYSHIERCAAGMATPEDINTLTAQIVTTKEPIDEQNIRSFLGDPQAVAAISLIRQTHDPDAIDVENDFLRLGMGKFYRKAKDLEAKAMYGNNNDTMTA